MGSKNGMTISEAAHEWVAEFDRVPLDVVRKLQEFSQFCDINEVTLPSVGENVYLNEMERRASIVEIIDHYPKKLYRVKTLDEKQHIVTEDKFYALYDTDLPAWGTMWSFSDSCDDDWLENMNGLQLMSDCGFRIYDSEDYGYIFGIDGGGYDFYEEHWIPLYIARGLQWHSKEEESND